MRHETKVVGRWMLHGAKMAKEYCRKDNAGRKRCAAREEGNFVREIKPCVRNTLAATGFKIDAVRTKE